MSSFGNSTILTGAAYVNNELRQQWSNPGDILSLLLLIGGEIVRKALAQLVGYRFPPWRKRKNKSHDWYINITPVAFSFGWVAYAFESLMTVFGECRLMPEPDTDFVVLNVSNPYVRDNKSWVLGRLLRDWETKLENQEHLWPSPPLDFDGKPRRVSLRVDIFEISSSSTEVKVDRKWWAGWAVICLQICISIIPWAVWGDYAIFMVTGAGTLFAMITGSLPQWEAEKWSWRKLRRSKTVVLTRGNGNTKAMVIVSGPDDWDLEALATGGPHQLAGTRWACLVLTVFWTLLLITVSGLKDHTWFLIAIGGIGMLQNVYAAGAPREPEASNIHLRPYKSSHCQCHPLAPPDDELKYYKQCKCNAVIGYSADWRQKEKRVDDASSDIEDHETLPPEEEDVSDVMGTLMEVEKIRPGVGAALVSVFFPGNLYYDGNMFKFNREKRFWKIAYKTRKARNRQLNIQA